MAPIEELVLLDLDRSNKGASKQRRDQINAEINILRDLLPLPESSRQRLSQLQVMSLSCVYIRKCNILQKLFRQQSHEPLLPDSLDFFQAMTGFLLVTTREGKLIYISENVTDYLGHSMVDMKTQGDSLYDIVDKRDHGTVQAKLLQGGAMDVKDISEDISFFCRMNMSRTLKRQSGFGDVKVMHIQGHFVAVTNSESGCLGDKQFVFMASCSPLITPDLKENLVVNNTMVFKTVHQLDMAFMEVTKMAEHHLGYTSEELSKTSWYSLIHPEDIHQAKEKHLQLVRSNHHEIGCMMTVRMIKANGSILWVNIVMHVKQTLLSQNDEPYIVCINQIISAQEAYQIRVHGQMFSMYPGRVQELWGSHVPSISPTQNYNVNQWIQQEGNNSVPVPGYPCPVPAYPSQPGYPMVYSTACSSMTDLDRSRKPFRNTNQSNLPNLVQTDKLKAMLKRKIQGPTVQALCKQAKVAKMSWDVGSRSERQIYQEIEQPSLIVPEQYRNGEVRHAMQGQGQVVQVMMANGHLGGLNVTKKSYKSVPDMIPHKFSTSSSRVKVEQVVPDISVPDSYLTPDPSPISSPEPSNMVKTEVMDPDEPGSNGTSSVCILQALEKLASQPQDGLRTKSQVPTVTKQVCQDNSQMGKSGNEELPIFDAFEIEDFFETLDIPKASLKMEIIKLEQDIKTDCCNENRFQMPSLKKERELNFMSQQTLDDSNSIPHLPPVMEMPLLQIKNEMEAEAANFHRTSRKDLVVSSTMVQSPKSVGSQETMTRCESLDELLSCFSDESLETSQFYTDCNRPNLEMSVCKSVVKDPLDVQKMSSIDSFCPTPIYLRSQGVMEELSPQSTSSCLSREDEMLDQSSMWNLSLKLDVLESNDQLESPHHTDIRNHDGLEVDNVFDEVDMLLDSFVPTHGSLEMLKHGQ